MHLAEHVDFVIGVDTHKQCHVLGLVAATGTEVEDVTFATDAFGYKRMLAWAKQRLVTLIAVAGRSRGREASGRGSPHSSSSRGEWVVEIDRPKRPAWRNGAKSDVLDAYRAAREALTRSHLAQPPDVEAFVRQFVFFAHSKGAVRSRSRALCHLQALIVNAPVQLRDQLRRDQLDVQVERCARLRVLAEHSVEHRCTVRALRATARRIQMLSAEADDLETELALLVAEHAPELLAEPGIGTISAAQVLNAWSHAGRIRSEAPFAMLSGSAPIPASSGQVVRHRLNRSGDRQLNRALHTVVLSRMRFHPETKEYVARRTAEGRTPREIKRCLKRFVARRLFRVSRLTLPRRNRVSWPLDRHRSILAVALATTAVESGYRGYFTHRRRHGQHPGQGQAGGHDGHQAQDLHRPSVLVIDDVGLLPIDGGPAPSSTSSTPATSEHPTIDHHQPRTARVGRDLR